MNLNRVLKNNLQIVLKYCSSFLDNEPIEYRNKYLGKRISRGLFISHKGIIINTDVNGAYNILKKAFLKAVDADRIEAVGLHPTRWRLTSVTSSLMTSCK